MLCPEATQNEQLNAQNRARTAQQFGYGPQDPMQPNEQFWVEKSYRWKLPVVLAHLRRCGNCKAYDVSAGMQACGGSTADGKVGYCHMHDFKCSALRTCDTWAPGGPIT